MRGELFEGDQGKRERRKKGEELRKNIEERCFFF